MSRERKEESRRGRAWRIIRHHYGARRAFNEIFRLYEARVAALVKERGTTRDRLNLTADQTKELFDTGRLRAVIAEEMVPLREAAHALFRDHDIAEPYDSKVSRIYHELSILKEEHLSVRDFPRGGGTREFSRLYREVSEYYPERLRRVRDLFNRAQRRLEELLPSFRDDVILLRSVYLFREELWPEGTSAGLTRFLTKLFPAEGSAYGYLQIARSFFRAGFFAEAAACARMGASAEGQKAQARSSRAQQLRETISELDSLAARADAERRALRELEA